MLNKFSSKQFTAKSGLTIGYRLYVPANYDNLKKYPFVLFLHGAGERGNDNESQLKLGIKNAFENENCPIYDCIVLAPQCPSEYKWVEVEKWTDCIYSTDNIPESKPLCAVRELMENIFGEYSVDANRVYVTGLSMGGYGTWDLLVRHTDMFAAAIPICGGCDVDKAEQLADMPIKTFHGELDDVVLPNGTKAMYERLCSLGNKDVSLKIYPELAHGIWGYVYETDGLFEWLLSHEK